MIGRCQIYTWMGISRKEVEVSVRGRHVPLQVARMSAVHDDVLLLSLPRRNDHLKY